MIKTIKVKKQMRLDELIKKVWDGQLPSKIYVSDKGLKEISVIDNGIDCNYIDNGIITSGDTFTVEVEEEITEDTVFEKVYRVTQEGEVTSDNNKSISDCLDWKDYQVQIFAMLEGKLQLIWEA